MIRVVLGEDVVRLIFCQENEPEFTWGSAKATPPVATNIEPTWPNVQYPRLITRTSSTTLLLLAAKGKVK